MTNDFQKQIQELQDKIANLNREKWDLVHQYEKYITTIHPDEELIDDKPLGDFSWCANFHERWPMIAHWQDMDHHDIGDELVRIGIVKASNLDCETNMFWAYFDTKHDGVRFLNDLAHYVNWLIGIDYADLYLKVGRPATYVQLPLPGLEVE